MQTDTPKSKYSRIFAPILASARLIILAGILGGLLGILVAQALNPRWIAKMTIQIGQISTSQQTGTGNRLLENQLTAAERFNVPSFRLNVLKQMGLPEPNHDNKQSDEIFDSLRSTPAKSSDLINVQVSAYSRDDAIKALNVSFDIFYAEHRKMYDPSVARLDDELKRTTTILDTAEHEYAQTTQTLQSSARGNAKAESRDVLLTTTAATLNQQIVDLTRRKAELADTLAPLRTYPTRVFGELYAPDRPLTPSALAIILMGLAGGLVIGIAIVMLTHSLRKESSWS